MRRSAPHICMLAALLALTFGSGCSDPDAPNVGTEDNNNAPVPCETSADCEGGLCLLDECRACVDDAACAQDGIYGAGATCNEGVCEPCFGQEGCACDEGACGDDLICEGEVCVECTRGTEGCECFGNDTCLDGNRCADERCEVCPPGEEGCACGDEDACGEGLTCMNDLCVVRECVPGIEDCPCRDDEDDACDEGLVCVDGGLCAECTPEFEGCPCDDEGQCGEELVCDEDEETCRAPRTCADLPCVENQLCQAEDIGVDALCLEECAEGFVYDPETGACDVQVDPVPNCQPEAELSLLAECQGQNRACVEVGETAMCGGCLPEFIEEDEACRAVITCDALDCADQNRACAGHTDTTDAFCEGCLMGFEENEGVCEAIPELNCTPGDPNSILDLCNGQDRECVEGNGTARCGVCREGFAEDPDTQECVRRLCIDLPCADLGRVCEGEPLAECGACLEGLVETDENDPLSQCRELVACADIEAECQGNGQICVEREGVDAVCADWPCLLPDDTPDFNRAFRVDQNRCTLQECGLACGLEGETGRIHPYTLENSERCICETEPGFYILPEGDFAAKPCDADGDGWIAQTARDAFESGDESLIANARCELRTIDRVVLENEYRQTRTILLCEEGLVPQIACDVQSCNEEGLDCADCNGGRCNPISNTCTCGSGTNFVDLYESVRNDDQQTLDAEGENDMPTYAEGERGRRLRAEELTPLTRACVSITGDANDNGVRDIIEWHGDEPTDDPELNLWAQFSYFVELHEGRYERTLGEEIGRYHVAEKSRCGADFPVRADTVRDGGYWRSCARNRDVAFDDNGENALIGHDFARWTCELPALGCPTPPPLTDQTPDGEVPPHGLCEQGVTLPPIDGIWRGMNHASQFKCTQLVDELPEERDALAPHQRLLSELASAEGVGDLQFNRCGLACPSPSIDFERPNADFEDTGALTLNGVDVGEDVEFLNVPARNVPRGSAFLTRPIALTGDTAIRAHFLLELSPFSGEGMAFVLHNDPSGERALGDGAHGLGFVGISPSVAIEFDTLENEDHGDRDDSHIALVVDGRQTEPLAYENPDEPLAEFEGLFVWVEYEPSTTTLSLYINEVDEQPIAPLWAADIDLVSALGDRAYLGFTGADADLISAGQRVFSWGVEVGRDLDIDADLDCAQDCGEEGCEVSSVAREGNASVPVIACRPVPAETVSVGDVGFAAVRYTDNTIDVRGCIDESRPDPNFALSEFWRQMCPGYINNPDAVVVDDNAGNFGKIICGCGFNFGGPNCDRGCPGTFDSGLVHYGGSSEDTELCANGYCPINPDGNEGGRLGFWLCGDMSTTSYEDTEGLQALTSERWGLSGEVPMDGVDRQRLCTGDDCATGFRVR